MVRMGARLRALREERGLTQQVAARAAGITTDMISRLENGRYKSPGLRTLLRIANGLGVSLSSVMPDRARTNYGPENALKARLMSTAHRACREDLELLSEFATLLVERRERSRA